LAYLLNEKNVIRLLSMFDQLKERVHVLKKESMVLYYSSRDPSLALWKKAFIALVIGYLFSPIDLIPDFIPIIGYLDDLLIVPAGIYIALKIIPQEILDSARQKVTQHEMEKKPVGYKTSLVIIFLWLISIIIFVYWLLKLLSI